MSTVRELTIYQVDAFANRPFTGNPAAICPLEQWLPDAVLLAIAEENNLSETAYFVKHQGRYHIRWFTPAKEVELCGHATLASAFVLFHILGHQSDTIQFQSLSGTLSVMRLNNRLIMDLPAQPPQPCAIPAILLGALAQTPTECLRHTDYIAVFDDEQAVLNADPDLELLKQLDARGLAITAPGNKEDFVCRFFAPAYGINEDPVTGSAFTQLTPYWAERLGRSELQARQVSRRGGDVGCILAGDRVNLVGQAALYMTGKIHIPLI